MATWGYLKVALCGDQEKIITNSAAGYQIKIYILICIWGIADMDGPWRRWLSEYPWRFFPLALFYTEAGRLYLSSFGFSL